MNPDQPLQPIPPTQPQGAQPNAWQQSQPAQDQAPFIPPPQQQGLPPQQYPAPQPGQNWAQPQAPQYDTAPQATQPPDSVPPAAQPTPEPIAHALYERPSDPTMHPMVVLQPGESIVTTIKRHPFGILSLYAWAILGITIAAVLAFVFLPSLLGQSSAATADPAIYAGLGIFVIIMVLVLLVATTVYWQNQWVVTTDSITQITQNGLFGRQVSQLSMDNLEDVTVNQDGIIPHLFKFGTLRVETAGEKAKFQFPYCPDPNTYARRILEVHEHFLEERRNIQNR